MKSKPFNPNCTETTSLSMVVGQCIQRELFFQCPGLSNSTDCSALVKYGKACPLFPMPPKPEMNARKSYKGQTPPVPAGVRGSFRDP